MDISLAILVPLLLLVLLGGAVALMAVMIERFARARKNGVKDGAWVSAPMTLGITGGVTALALSVLLCLDAITTALLVFSLLAMAGGAAGIIGGALVRRHRHTAGILMLAGGLASFLSLFGPLLLITGGVLALVDESKKE